MVNIMEIRKDASELYSLLSYVLDCDYRRLIDAFDKVDGDTLDSAISEARDDDDLSLERIMREVIDIAFRECDYSFYKERDRKLAMLNEDLDEYETLDNLDMSSIRDSIQYEDGICWDKTHSDYSEEEMKIYTTYLSDSFGKLEDMIGYIDGLPREDN